MRYSTLLWTIAMGLWPVATPAIQAPVANALPAHLRPHVNEDRFEMVTSVRGLPLGVREELQTLFRSTFLDIAEPGAPFRAADVVDANSPTRRLVMAACSIDHCLVYYERGGKARTWYLTLFHWTPAATRLDWGGIAPSGLKTIDDLRKAALAGSIRAASVW